MKDLKPGTKVRMLKDCYEDDFLMGDILTIGIKYYEANGVEYYHCKESRRGDIHGRPARVSTDTDKFEIVNLDVLKEIGD